MTTCPACDSGETEIVSRQTEIPVNSCLLVDTEQNAANFPRGNIDLAVCRSCGFLFNAAFEPSLVEYSGRYEETQAYSARFREFADDLARDWVQRYDIRDKSITEIGCGKAEFLSLICAVGGNRGIGIDPGVDADRFTAEERERLTLIPEFYDESYGALDTDVVICRHTLEHIPTVAKFLRDVRAGIGDRLDTVVLFELPDVARVLSERAFWDVYYEHCSYFTTGSLARLFRQCGFAVDDVRLAFDGQYILLEARPVAGPVEQDARPIEETPATVVDLARSYGAHVSGLIDTWKKDLFQARAVEGGSVAIWGAGSKGVSFLTHVGPDNVDLAVDINPRKAGMYLPGTKQIVSLPDELVARQPAMVIAMNEIYVDEIAAQLRELGLNPTLRAV